MGPVVALRRAELARRVDALPGELKAWVERSGGELDQNVHFSQVQKISDLLGVAVAHQRQLLGALDADPARFGETAWVLTEKVIQAQRVWDFFRDKLNLRLVPAYAGPLWVADTVAWDCYQPVLDEALIAGVVSRDQYREPPLTYLVSEFSPHTYERDTRPWHNGRANALGTARLPIPVIGLPWDHLPNPWEFGYLAHEVGHDLEVDLKLKDPLAQVLADKLTAAGVDPERAKCWLAWQREVFADLVALQLVGPAYADGLSHILLLPAAQVTTDPTPTSLYPPHYLRILMLADYIPRLVPNRAELSQHAQGLRAAWVGMFQGQPKYDPWAPDFPAVFDALTATALPALGNKSVAQLIPFTAGDDARIRAAAGYLLTGQNAPAALRPRHCVSAARMAATAAAAQPGDVGQALADIAARTEQLVRRGAPAGRRGSDEAARKKRLAADAQDLGL